MTDSPNDQSAFNHVRELRAHLEEALRRLGELDAILQGQDPAATAAAENRGDPT